MCVLCPEREDGRDVGGEGARDGDGEWFSKDLKLSRMVDLDGKRRKLFFWPDMVVIKTLQCSLAVEWLLPCPMFGRGWLFG